MINRRHAHLALAGVLTLMLTYTTVGTSTAEESVVLDVAPGQVRTVAMSLCGPPGLSTAGTNCQGFDARQIREQSDIFVVGFENNAELREKHVLQTVAVFELAPLRALGNAELASATLGYGEASTTRRSATGDSEYGILPTCNTKLGVPTSGSWDGSTDKLVPTQPAQIAAVSPATTGDGGAWDVTPQVKAWLATSQSSGTLVLSSDDETRDIKAQSMCLSYVIGLNLSVEMVTKP